MDIRVPKLADGFTGGTVVAVQVKEGSRVKKDDVLLEMETEKAVGPIPSPASGIVEKVHVQAGAEVALGQLLVTLREEGAGKPVPEPGIQPSQSADAPVSVAAPSPKGAEGYRYESKSGLPPPAPPSIRRLCEELGLDLTRIAGNGPGGRIGTADLRAYLARLQASPASAEPKAAPECVDFSKWGPVTRKPISALRKKIAESMTSSWTTIPQVTQFDEAGATRLEMLREKYKKAYGQSGAHLTVTVLLLKALAELLKKHPVFNSGLDEATREIVERQYFNIGMAVDTPQGLIVPVVRDVDKKNCLELAREIGDIAERTRERKITLEELQGGCMTLSNQGGLGGAHFTPIIRKPESAILGVGRAREKAVAAGGKTAVRLMMPLSLTHDHRLIDGADAVKFLRDLVELIENYDENSIREGLKGKPMSNTKSRSHEGKQKR